MNKTLTYGQKKYLRKRLKDIFWINDYELLDAKYLKYEMNFTTKFKDFNWGSFLSLMIKEKIIKRTLEMDGRTEFRHPNYLYEFTGVKRREKYRIGHNFYNGLYQKYNINKKNSIIKVKEEKKKELLNEFDKSESDFLELDLEQILLEEIFTEEENLALKEKKIEGISEEFSISEKDIALTREIKDLIKSFTELFNEVKFEFKDRDVNEKRDSGKSILLKISLFFE